jgi:hypothetical protein
MSTAMVVHRLLDKYVDFGIMNMKNSIKSYMSVVHLERLGQNACVQWVVYSSISASKRT